MKPRAAVKTDPPAPVKPKLIDLSSDDESAAVVQEAMPAFVEMSSDEEEFCLLRAAVKTEPPAPVKLRAAEPSAPVVKSQSGVELDNIDLSSLSDSDVDELLSSDERRDQCYWKLRRSRAREVP